MTEDHVDDTERWALTRAGLQQAGGPGSVTPPGLLRIAAERLRHLRVGHDAGHDDRMTGGQLVDMALWWADESAAPVDWPWDEPTEDLPTRGTRVQDLIRAGALIAAEIDRLLRAQEPTS